MMFKSILNYSTYADVHLVIIDYGETMREADNAIFSQLIELDRKHPELGIDITEAAKADIDTFELTAEGWQ